MRIPSLKKYASREFSFFLFFLLFSMRSGFEDGLDTLVVEPGFLFVFAQPAEEEGRHDGKIDDSRHQEQRARRSLVGVGTKELRGHMIGIEHHAREDDDKGVEL